jgi:hypothetical protein
VKVALWISGFAIGSAAGELAVLWPNLNAMLFAVIAATAGVLAAGYGLGMGRTW